jgi:hypothetical protein
MVRAGERCSSCLAVDEAGSRRTRGGIDGTAGGQTRKALRPPSLPSDHVVVEIARVSHVAVRNQAFRAPGEEKTQCSREVGDATDRCLGRCRGVGQCNCRRCQLCILISN